MTRIFATITIILIFITGVLFCGCTKFTGSDVPLYKGDMVEADTIHKVLVAYFSRSGNTEKLAETIADYTGGKLFRIEKATPYPADFRECATVAKQELENNTVPTLKEQLVDFDTYDVVFVGCPVWWHTAPMPIHSFLKDSHYSFQGKIVVPFCTYSNMFPHETLLKMVELTPESIHPDGFVSQEGDTTGVQEWLKGIRLLR